MSKVLFCGRIAIHSVHVRSIKLLCEHCALPYFNANLFLSMKEAFINELMGKLEASLFFPAIKFLNFLKFSMPDVHAYVDNAFQIKVKLL